MAALAFAAGEPKPTAEAVLDRYIEVTGGKAAYEKVHSKLTKGHVEFVGKGMKGTATSYSTEPNNVYTVIELPGIGKIEEGTNGEMAWSNSAMQGPRVKPGNEKDLSIRMARFNGDLHWRELVKKAELTGAEEIDGKECYRVVLTLPVGNPITRYYDKSTGLLVRSKIVVPSPMGDISSESDSSDYKEVNGIRTPHSIRQRAMGQEMLITTESIQYNVNIPKERFEPPSEVKALAK